MERVLPLLVLLDAFPARGEQTKWIYRNPSTGAERWWTTATSPMPSETSA